MLTIHLMEAHEFNPIESVSYKAELADSLTNDTSAAQGMCFEFSRQFFLEDLRRTTVFTFRDQFFATHLGRTQSLTVFWQISI